MFFTILFKSAFDVTNMQIFSETEDFDFQILPGAKCIFTCVYVITSKVALWKYLCTLKAKCHGKICAC